MLLSSVILILQETLEAALLVSVLLVICFDFLVAKYWLPWSFVGGMVLAFTYAENMAQVSEWFNYMGQEVVNASLQIIISMLIIIFTWTYCHYSRSKKSLALKGVSQACAIGCIAFAMCREGSEIVIFLGGFLDQREDLEAVLIGGGIGFGIGVSVGVLLFYVLISFSLKARELTALMLLALFSGNMLSQSVSLLTQADLLPSVSTAWDASGFLSEGSVLGQLLYALIGYEATPSYVQVVGYFVGAILVVIAALSARYPKQVAV